jgi:hypothetical protein
VQRGSGGIDRKISHNPRLQARHGKTERVKTSPEQRILLEAVSTSVLTNHLLLKGNDVQLGRTP